MWGFVATLALLAVATEQQAAANALFTIDAFINSMTLPLAFIAGAPAYLKGYAAIPLVRSLIDLGMPASAGPVFMLAGSVTSIPTAIKIFY